MLLLWIFFLSAGKQLKESSMMPPRLRGIFEYYEEREGHVVTQKRANHDVADVYVLVRPH